MGSDVKIARALISVTDKTGVVDFARTLVDDFGRRDHLYGGTARAIEDAGVPVTPIEEFTGYPEMMDGRVKTLHPKVHGALLARRDSEQHMQEAAQHGIKLIDLVVVNLYEFEKTVANPEVTFADAIEHIDIGGPSMLRSAAKNAASVTVISDPADYDAVLAEMRETGGCTTLSTRRRLQVKVYQTTAAYDTAISRWLCRPRKRRGGHLCQARDLAGEGRRPALWRESSAEGHGLSLCRGLREYRELAVPARGLRADPGQAAQLQQLSGCRRRLEPSPRVRRCPAA